MMLHATIRIITIFSGIAPSSKMCLVLINKIDNNVQWKGLKFNNIVCVPVRQYDNNCYIMI